jgi:hypothetical protein
MKHDHFAGGTGGASLRGETRYPIRRIGGCRLCKYRLDLRPALEFGERVVDIRAALGGTQHKSHLLCFTRFQSNGRSQAADRIEDLTKLAGERSARIERTRAG